MSTASQEPRLGVDIGRVLIHGDGPDTSFVGGTDDDALRTPPLPGALESLARLVELFEGRVWLVSKCGKRVEQRSRAWLAHHDAYARTGLAPERVLFCRDRADKAPLAQKLGLQLFVDDRVDILCSMEGLVAHRFLFGAERSPARGLTPVPGWAEAEPAVRAAWESLSARGGQA